MLQKMSPRDWENTILNKSVARSNLRLRGTGAFILYILVVWLVSLPLFNSLDWAFWVQLLYMYSMLMVSRLIAYIPCAFVALFVENASGVLLVCQHIVYILLLPIAYFVGSIW